MSTPAPITAASTLTPITGAASYCTAAQLFTCFDVRTVADLLSDGTTPIGWISPNGPVDKSVVAADANLALLLQAASGKVEAAVQVGQRYTPGDLIALTTGAFATSNAAMFIAELVAGITIASLYRRRPDVQMPKIEIVEDSKELLAALANGEAILPLQEVMDAGRMENQVETLDDVVQRNMPSWENRRVFGTRNKWRDGNSGTSCDC